MKIGVIDVDSKLPNLALMKIAGYYRKQGQQVSHAFDLNMTMFDKLYASSLFDFSQKPIIPDKKDVFFTGGPGYSHTNTLPEEIENSQPYYSLYPGCNFSYQRFSKGCIRECEFCVVPELEGKIRPVTPMNLNPRGKYIYILDSNFFSSPEWRNAMRLLRSYNQPLIHMEGVDIRILTGEMVGELCTLRLKKGKRFFIAWDNPVEKIDRKIEKVIPEKKRYKFMCYVLIGWNSTHEENLYRVLKLRELGIDPFIMPYDKSDPYQADFARWVNHKAVFKSCTWDEYAKRGNNKNKKVHCKTPSNRFPGRESDTSRLGPFGSCMDCNRINICGGTSLFGFVPADCRNDVRERLQ